MINPTELCLETIRCFNGQLENLELHSQRLNHTRKSLWGLQNPIAPLNELIEIPDDCKTGLYKCRITYGPIIEQIDWEAYKKRIVESIRIIESPNANYCFKYKDRDHLNSLFSQRGKFDDILISKKGYLTDTFVCNIAFFDGDNWYTPSQPLLNGTQRMYLINNKVILTKNIHQNDLGQFEKVRLFNAMMPWHEAIELPITGIHTQ